MEYRRLFSPLNIGSLTIPNRIIMPALHLVYCQQGEVTQKLISFYTRRAEGGAGLLIVGGCSVAEEGRSRHMIGIHHPCFQPGLQALTQAVHDKGGLVFAQLFHAGRYAKPDVTGTDAVAPSAVYSRYSNTTPRALDEKEIISLAERFAQGAKLAKSSGFDGVEILGSAGYLISQFLSPVTNLRDDAFGGSEDNRLRFCGMVLDMVRNAVGTDFPISVRIAGNEFMTGGNGFIQAEKLGKYLQAHGADSINVTGGWHETNVPQLTGHLPPGGFSYLSAEIKRQVTIPVFASNRINSPVIAEEILALEYADGICMGRQLVCDPDTPKKARDGKWEEIVPCVACGQGCSDHTFSGKPMGCALNPLVGKEHCQSIKTAALVKKVVVVGGGASGIACAVTAAMRGHKVSLYERQNHLGGRLNSLAELNGSADCGRLLVAGEKLLRQYGVTVYLGKEFQPFLIDGLSVDHVVLATGNEAVFPNEIDNFGGIVCSVDDILQKRVIAGTQVVIICAENLGVETAIVLQKEAVLSPQVYLFLLRYKGEDIDTLEQLNRTTNRKVTVLNKDASITRHIGQSTRWVISNEAKHYGISGISCIEPPKFRSKGVEITLSDGTNNFLPADTIVITKQAPHSTLAQELTKRNISFNVIGDANGSRAKAYVIGAGAQTGMKL